MKILFYKIYINQTKWKVGLIKEHKIYIVENNIDKLKDLLKDCNLLVGLNNYNYDDILIVYILKNTPQEELYKISTELLIREFKNRKNIIHLIPTYDVSSDIKPYLTPQFFMNNLGYEISYEIDKELKIIQEIFYARRDIFDTKLEILKEFNLSLNFLKKSFSSLASIIFNTIPIKTNDRLNIRFVDNLNFKTKFNNVYDFYKNKKILFSKGVNYELLESDNYTLELNNLTLTLGYGGLHGDIKKVIYKGNLLYIDINFFYPTLVKNYSFYSRAIKNTKLFDYFYNKRLELKEQNDPKEKIYKELLNSVVGAYKDTYSDFYDPLQNNNVVINGQLIMLDIVDELLSFNTTIYQVNTDGIILSYENEELIFLLIKELEKKYKLKITTKKAKELYQRDVNNYILVFEDNTTRKKGVFNDKPEYLESNYSIINKALSEFYINDIPIEKTINSYIEDNKLLPFKINVHTTRLKAHYSTKLYEGYKSIGKNNLRVFASFKTIREHIFLTTDEKGTFKYEISKNTPQDYIIHNDSIETLNKRMININFYIELVNKYKIENYKTIKYKYSTKNSFFK